MGYSIYITGELTPSRKLSKEEQEYIINKFDLSASGYEIDFGGVEYHGICPCEHFEDTLDNLGKYGKEKGFTISGELYVDETEACEGESKWIIKDSFVETVEGQVYLSDVTEYELLLELERRKKQ